MQSAKSLFSLSILSWSLNVSWAKDDSFSRYEKMYTTAVNLSAKNQIHWTPFPESYCPEFLKMAARPWPNLLINCPEKGI
jgi:hypothetical protein